MEEQGWDGRPGCWEAIKALEELLEHELTKDQRDLFEFAYIKGYDKRVIHKGYQPHIFDPKYFE